MKIVVVQRTICHYQLPYYLMLDAVIAETGNELTILAGVVEDADYHPREGLFIRLKHYSFEVHIGGLRDKLILLPSLYAALTATRPDIIVVEDISAMPNCLTAWFYCRRNHIPYLIWGPGSIPNKKPSRIRPFLEPLISLFRKNCAAFVCYSTYAKQYYERLYSKPGFVAYNSTAPQYTPDEYRELELLAERKFHSDTSHKILYIGRLLPQKRVNLMIEALARLKDLPSWTADIIGDGPAMPALEAQSAHLGLQSRIQFHGALTDPAKKRSFFLQAHLGILPGLGGLAIQEMLRYGVPVISTWADGTEQDLIIEGHGGIFVDPMHSDSLASAIRGYLESAPQDKIGLARNALSTIRNQYNLESMVNAFQRALQYAK